MESEFFEELALWEGHLSKVFVDGDFLTFHLLFFKLQKGKHAKNSKHFLIHLTADKIEIYDNVPVI